MYSVTQQYNARYVWTLSAVAALGGLLFGYDFVVIGGAKPFYESYFRLDSQQLVGWANSCALLGCLVGSILSGVGSGRLGRKKLLIFSAILFAVSSVLTGWAQTFASFVSWRIAGGMAIGVLQFVWSRRLLGEAGARPTARGPHASQALALGLLLLCALAALVFTGRIRFSPTTSLGASTGLIAAIAALYFAYLLFGAGLDGIERRRVGVIVLLFLAATLFWGGYEQSGSSFNLFAERDTDRTLHGFIVPAAWFQALNPLFIVVFGPILGALWVWLGRRNLDPSIPLKFILGLLFMGLGFVVMAIAARRVVAGELAGMGALVLTYLLHTFGELALSPVGLSAVSKLVPRRFIGQSLGVWFASLSLGELVAGRLAGDFDPAQAATLPWQFMRVFWFSAICAVALAALMPLMRRWMAGVR